MARSLRLKGEELARWHADWRLVDEDVAQQAAMPSQLDQRIVPSDEQVASPAAPP